MATKAASKSKSASTTRQSSSTPAKRSGTSTAKKAAKRQRPIRREVGAVVCFFLGIFCIIGYFPVDALFITYFCRLVKGLIGYGYYLFPLALLLCAWILITHRGRPVVLRVSCALLIPLLLGALIHVFASDMELNLDRFAVLMRDLFRSGQEMHSGGLLSGLIGMGFKAMFSIYGAVIVLFFGLLILSVICFRISPAKVAESIKNRPHVEYELQEEPEPVRAPARTVQRPAPVPEQTAVQATRRRRQAIDIPMDDDEPEKEPYEEKKTGFFNSIPRVRTPDQVVDSKGENTEPKLPETRPVTPQYEAFRKESAAPAAAAPAAAAAATAHVKPMSLEEAADIAGVSAAIQSQEVSSEEKSPARGKKAMGEEALRQETEEVARTIAENEEKPAPEYVFPPLELLHKGKSASVDGREEMAINRERLQSTLDSFGVNATITDITRGPTVTRYDLELEAGVKLTKLTNLAGDLALSLGVSGVRIAPIPDRISTVGVEVPNKIVSTVYLRDIIGSDAFRNASSKLTFAIGEDISGSSVCGNIAKLPHMLIAGTTGSGKSVCMNSLILSLLYKARPDEVKLIMIDPKMVELGIYNGIPHLYIPVVTDPKKAAGALQWAVVEMLKRYRLFSEVGVRDLASYNAMQQRNGEEILPQVVIVIDELADLMLVASKEVEESICRVAQMGRASGMHLVIATQRPSADVITGLMKANIPSRIAFAVSSALESRIILDTMGAEKLIGQGDMLYAPIGVGKPQRIQGAFVTDEEREEVVNFIKQNGTAEYNDEILSQIEQAAADKSGGKAESVSEPEEKSEYDELLPQAAEVIFETKQASVSMLQRRLKLGYSRAARIVDQMEELGIVGPFEGSKPRQILITREQWQEMQLINGTAPTEQYAQAMSMAEDYENSEESGES